MPPCGDAAALFVRSTLAGAPLHDVMGRWQARQTGPKTLVLRGPLPAGLYELALATEPGTFPSESLMLELTEWPTMATVPAGPFDFDHTDYRMVVPTFRVAVDDRDGGLAWCEAPTPEDMRDRRIRGRWGIAVEGAGEHEIRLELPADDDRLRWADLSRIELRDDGRFSAGVGDVRALASRRPRLFTDAEQLESLRAERDPNQQTIFDALVGHLESGADGTYLHRTVKAALVGLVTGESRWIEEAIGRTLELCERPYWGYHDVREVMGWNNDRDTGVRMFETAVVYDWLHDRLTDEQRQLIRDKLAYHAELADRVTHLQKGYWYTRTTEAHGQGFWFGFTSAALALLGDDPRAEGWLAWAHGNMLDALTHAPDDGIVEWPVFNAQWLILTAMLLERATGRRLRGRLPFLRNYAANCGKLGRTAVLHAGHNEKRSLLLFWLAGRHRDRRAQADALAEMQWLLARADNPEQQLDPFVLLAYDPSVAPSKPSRPAAALCSQGGTVVCRDSGNGTGFAFCCGTPLTPRHHESHVWLAQAWVRPQHAGSFGWEVAGQPVIPIHVPTYRGRTRDANLITVDGEGHYGDGRWLGSAIPLSRVSRIEHFAAVPGVTYCHGNAAPSYTEASGVKQLTRRWVYLHKAGLVVMHDTVATTGPRELAWHTHTVGQWRQAGSLAFVADGKGSGYLFRDEEGTRTPADIELAVRMLPADGDAVTAEVSPSHYVPPYSCGGLNAYKTLDWQKEAHKRMKQPPDFLELIYRPEGTVSRWECVTVMGPDTKAVLGATRSDKDGVTEISLGRAGAVLWSADGAIRVEALDAEIEAEMVIRTGPESRPGRWLTLGTRQVRQSGQSESWNTPTDLVWPSTGKAPRKIGRQATQASQ